MEFFENLILDEERAFYGAKDIRVFSCNFDGPADGESALKECDNILVENSYFNLRYPMWHDRGIKVLSSSFTDKCRAALWYSSNVDIKDSALHGTKALRECDIVNIGASDIISDEFGWICRDVKMNDCIAEGEYFMLNSRNICVNNLKFKGKYSFQYIENTLIENSVLNTKDAFWHAKNVVVRNSIVNGEYLGWYCENVTFENCVISGTQPLCYCKNLKLINCEMHECDLAFEKSEVQATVTTSVISIKNPLSGSISVPFAGEIIRDDARSECEIIITGDSNT